MFARLLIWLLAIVAGWWLLRSRGRAAPPLRGDDASRRAVAPPEAMVDCAHCGLHLPASEAVRDTAARTFCCSAHAEAGPRDAR
jgi:uncharacterized protein